MQPADDPGGPATKYNDPEGMLNEYAREINETGSSRYPRDRL